MVADPGKKKAWRTVQLPDGLICEVEKYLKTPEARKRGFTSISGYIEHALRKELKLD